MGPSFGSLSLSHIFKARLEPPGLESLKQKLYQWHLFFIFITTKGPLVFIFFILNPSPVYHFFKSFPREAEEEEEGVDVFEEEVRGGATF